MFERFKQGAFDIATASKAPEPHLWGVATKSDVAGEATRENSEKRYGAAADRARMKGGMAQLDGEILRRMSREIFRDLGLKEAAIAAYFARYGNASHRKAETA
ncbi:hypothetical protein [Rhodoblastus sp.]|jgi:hypothetical protein|uniref:hypothetical protein n=1 Tax=Rhodoblastus sp. TaxID=1962975 RepID=UPI0025F2F9CC|nr:hypothetical protein [Rhodoblastus sp.]